MHCSQFDGSYLFQFELAIMWCTRGVHGTVARAIQGRFLQTFNTGRSFVRGTRHGWSTDGSAADKCSVLPCRFFTTGTIVSSRADGGRRWHRSVTNKSLLLSMTGTGAGSAFLGYLYILRAQDIVTNAEVLSNFKLTLYQYRTCPFCCKVRAFLDYNGLPYEIVEVNPVFRQQIKFSKWRKVPILIVEGPNQYQQLNDSSVIISLLSSLLFDPSKSVQELANFYPAVSHVNESDKKVEVPNRYYLMYSENFLKRNRSEEEAEEERKWRMWADNRLVHMLSPNVYRSPREALQAFQWFSEVGDWQKHFSFLERIIVVYIGATAMFFIGKRLKRRHNLQNDVRQPLYSACEQWLNAVGPDRLFMGGDKPNLADLAVYGVLGSIEGCDAFKDVLENTKIRTWFYRTKAAVDSHSGSTAYRLSL